MGGIYPPFRLFLPAVSEFRAGGGGTGSSNQPVTCPRPCPRPRRWELGIVCVSPSPWVWHVGAYIYMCLAGSAFLAVHKGCRGTGCQGENKGAARMQCVSCWHSVSLEARLLLHRGEPINSTISSLSLHQRNHHHHHHPSSQSSPGAT